MSQLTQLIQIENIVPLDKKRIMILPVIPKTLFEGSEPPESIVVESGSKKITVDFPEFSDPKMMGAGKEDAYLLILNKTVISPSIGNKIYIKTQ